MWKVGGCLRASLAEQRGVCWNRPGPPPAAPPSWQQREDPLPPPASLEPVLRVAGMLTGDASQGDLWTRPSGHLWVVGNVGEYDVSLPQGWWGAASGAS